MPKLPSLYRRVLIFLQTYWKHLKLKREMVSDRMYANRLTICSICPNNVNGKCILCGCPLLKKARWKASDCPADKW